MSPAMEAHLRLLAQLPVRTHESRPYQEPVVRKTAQPRNKRGSWYTPRGSKKNKPGVARAVRVNGKIYASITQAKYSLRVSPATLYNMIDTGKAEYA